MARDWRVWERWNCKSSHLRRAKQPRPEPHSLESRDLPTAVFLPNVLDPVGVATDANGYVYVSYNVPIEAGISEESVVGKFTPSGQLVRPPSVIQVQNLSNPSPIPSGGSLIPGPGPTATCGIFSRMESSTTSPAPVP